MFHVPQETGVVLERLNCASSPGVRREAERALVSLAARVESSPALWKIDCATQALSLPGHGVEEVEAALVASGDESLFGVRRG